jgi:hypothetical protein
MERTPTLVVLDEVHHVGDRAAWGRAVHTMVGDVAQGEVHPVAVLNMTGTLFRSSGRLRISTVRYNHTAEADGVSTYEAVADASVRTSDLIGVHLRPPDLYVYGAKAELVDLHTEQVISGDIADLDRENRSRVIRLAATESLPWIEGFAKAALERLATQQAHIPDEPLKLLYVAANQRAARRAADAINRVANDDFARLVVSDEPGALRELRRAARERRSCAIVAVRMVTEGFDCPAVSTIAYASDWVAELFVAQMMARAMRITEAERRVGQVLPANILIPDHAELRQAFISALLNRMHVLEVKEEEPPPERDGIRVEPRLPRFVLGEVSDLEFRLAHVLGEPDGDVSPQEYEEWRQALEGVHLSPAFVPRVAVASRKVRHFPRIYDPPRSAVVEVAPANPRDLNKLHRERADQLAGWIYQHLNHDGRFRDIADFQMRANDAAGIPLRGRPHATTDQMARCVAWMAQRVREHCDRHNESPPEWLDQR